MKNRKRVISCMITMLLLLSTVFSQTSFSSAAVKKPKLSTKKVTLSVGESKKVKVRKVPKKAKISWKSKNVKIAKVTKKGMITAKKKGKTKVICKITYKAKGKKNTTKFVVAVKVNSKKVSTGLPKVTAVPGNTSPTAVPVQTTGPADTSLPAPTATKVDPAAFRVLSGDELIQDMGAGWNLGNTMDGHTGFTPGETIWQPYKTTKALIKSVHDMGFNTVRIPVTWGTMIDDENDYAINEKWMSRVQDIVDYCISQDMYAIVNIHHDGAEQTGWLRIATDDQAALEEKFAGVWKNIATTFRDYDEHLILESMNEVKGENMTTAEENAVIMKLNQIFVDTVRGTGSNNAQRFLMVPGKYNFIDSVCNEKNQFSLPKDSVDNRFIVSIHDYSPNNFCLGENMHKVNCDPKMIANNEKELKPLYDIYTSKGIPVVVGEYGCVNKNNPEERALYLEAMNRMFRKYKLVGVYWDMGWYDRTQEPADYSLTIIDRESGKPIDKVVTDSLMRGFFGLTGETDPTTAVKGAAVTPVSSLELPIQQVTLAMDEEIHLDATYAPDNSNDVLLWKTEDPSVATVSYGTIHPKGIGTTTVTLFSQNSDQSVSILVTVTEAQAKVPCEELQVGTESLELYQDMVEWLGAEVTPADCSEAIYYQSGDESVVTVSSVGKVLAVGAGETSITVGTSGGKTKVIPVKVSEGAVKTDISLAVNVYYNDEDNQYFGNEESSDVITVNQDGQYTLTFDCEKDLSKKAVDAGIESLNRVTAIYIKDHEVTAGEASTSPLSACDIRYDEIVVDGQKLTIKNNDFKSALKSSGIFDTNDPINSWDGSVVEEVEIDHNAVLFTGMTNPKKISITFTLQNIAFQGVN